MRKILIAALVATSFSPVAFVAPAHATTATLTQEQAEAICGALPNSKWEYRATQTVSTQSSGAVFTNLAPQNHVVAKATKSESVTTTTTTDCLAYNPADKLVSAKSVNDVTTETVVTEGVEVQICNGSGQQNGYTGPCPATAENFNT